MSNYYNTDAESIIYDVLLNLPMHIYKILAPIHMRHGELALDAVSANPAMLREVEEDVLHATGLEQLAQSVHDDLRLTGIPSQDRDPLHLPDHGRHDPLIPAPAAALGN